MYELTALFEGKYLHSTREPTEEASHASAPASGMCLIWTWTIHEQAIE